MASRKTEKPILLAWSERVETSAGVDPLGLALRVGARITSQLLHCITSITPRARYFSFLPWCIQDYRLREAGTNNARSLRQAIEIREHALVLGCILHHEGHACEGGGLTGSDKAIEWFGEGIPARPDLSSRSFFKNPALNAYFGSMANIGLIRPTEELVEDSEEEQQITFDDIELSDLGKRVATAYGLGIQSLPAPPTISKSDIIPREGLHEWGELGGLCALRLSRSPDREVLRDLFFSAGETSDAHAFRRQTLLLLLHFSDEFSDKTFGLNADAFSDATYFGRLVDWGSDDLPEPVVWPAVLADIALRWRMYHFHHYCWFALEWMFGAVVSEAQAADVGGLDLEGLLDEIGSRSGKNESAEVLGMNSMVEIATLTPRELWTMCGFNEDPMTESGSQLWDESVDARHVLSEGRLEDVLRRKEFCFAASILLGLVLLLSSIARYRRWEDTDYGKWLFGHAENDAFLDVTTPQVLRFLRQEFEDFTQIPLAKIAARILLRFVIRQHETMAFTKSQDGSRAFFHVDQGRIFTRAGKSWRPRLENGRLRSAVRILMDLGYLEKDDETEGAFRRTSDGSAYLQDKLMALENV